MSKINEINFYENKDGVAGKLIKILAHIDESIKELESPFPDINAKCLKATNIEKNKLKFQNSFITFQVKLY